MVVYCKGFVSDKDFRFRGMERSGKTTLVKAVIPALIGRDLKVSTIKHTHHNFDIDKPGKDSYEHRAAGAHEVVITGSSRWALLHETGAKRNRISTFSLNGWPMSIWS